MRTSEGHLTISAVTLFSKNWALSREESMPLAKSGQKSGNGASAGMTYSLFNVANVRIRRHRKVQGAASPDDQSLLDYWIKRNSGRDEYFTDADSAAHTVKKMLRLEPDEGKLSRPVLRGEYGRRRLSSYPACDLKFQLTQGYCRSS